MAKALRVESGIVCDDVRREDTGKLILIGAYGNTIGVVRFPASLVLNLVLIVHVEESEAHSIEFRVSLGESVLAQGKGKMNITDVGRLMINIPNIVLREMQSEGVLHFQVKTNGEWITVCDIPLVMAKPS
jgi:hypothetical protein